MWKKLFSASGKENDAVKNYFFSFVNNSIGLSFLAEYTLFVTHKDLF